MTYEEALREGERADIIFLRDGGHYHSKTPTNASCMGGFQAVRVELEAET